MLEASSNVYYGNGFMLVLGDDVMINTCGWELVVSGVGIKVVIVV